MRKCPVSFWNLAENLFVILCWLWFFAFFIFFVGSIYDLELIPQVYVDCSLECLAGSSAFLVLIFYVLAFLCRRIRKRLQCS